MGLLGIRVLGFRAFRFGFRGLGLSGFMALGLSAFRVLELRGFGSTRLQEGSESSTSSMVVLCGFLMSVWFSGWPETGYTWELRVEDREAEDLGC